MVLTYLIFSFPYTDVHIWLDELFPKYGGFGHWSERHHLQAIKEKYGENTVRYNVAYLHIICDWLSHLDRIEVPIDAQDVKNKLMI